MEGKGHRHKGHRRRRKLVADSRLKDGEFSVSPKPKRVGPVMSPWMRLLNETKSPCYIVRGNREGFLWLRFLSDTPIWENLKSSLSGLENSYLEMVNSFHLTVELILRDPHYRNIIFLIQMEVGSNKLLRVSEMRRVMITHIRGDKVGVLLIDYGTTDVVDPRKLAMLNLLGDAFLLIAPLIIRVRLEAIASLNVEFQEIRSAIEFPIVYAQLVQDCVQDGEDLTDCGQNTEEPEVRIWLPKRRSSAFVVVEGQPSGWKCTSTLSGKLFAENLAEPKEEFREIPNENIEM